MKKFIICFYGVSLQKNQNKLSMDYRIDITDYPEYWQYVTKNKALILSDPKIELGDSFDIKIGQIFGSSTDKEIQNVEEKSKDMEIKNIEEKSNDKEIKNILQPSNDQEIVLGLDQKVNNIENLSYQNKINQISKFNLSVFTNTKECISKLKEILYVKTFIIVSGAKSKEFFI